MITIHLAFLNTNYNHDTCIWQTIAQYINGNQYELSIKKINHEKNQTNLLCFMLYSQEYTVYYLVRSEHSSRD